MTNLPPLSRLLGATALALVLTAPVHAQSTGASNANSSTKAGASESGNANVDAGKADASGSGAAKISSEDKGMMDDIAHANLAEIETGKLALEKSQNPEVKKFAQKMIDDHTTAMKELQKLAQSKGVELPKETDIQHKTIATALKILSGDTFDSQYISRVGVGDHERTVGLLEETQKNAKDPELKAYAQKTLKVVKQHLQSAHKMEQKK